MKLSANADLSSIRQLVELGYDAIDVGLCRVIYHDDPYPHNPLLDEDDYEKKLDGYIEECRRLGLVNDELFARDCAEMLAMRGCGNYRIRRDLAKRGVAEFAPEAIEELSESESLRALEAARFKLRLLCRESDPRKKREKLYRFLAGRGFAPVSIRQALDRLRAEEEHPELADEEPDL